jgi:hypothetical protein
MTTSDRFRTVRLFLQCKQEHRRHIHVQSNPSANGRNKNAVAVRLLSLIVQQSLANEFLVTPPNRFKRLKIRVERAAVIWVDQMFVALLAVG